MQQEKKLIYSLQALRGIAFLGIFASHTGFRCFVGTGRWGVSVFFVLSGFMMIYTYMGKNRIRYVSLKDNLYFAWRKMKGLYLLHIIEDIS